MSESLRYTPLATRDLYVKIVNVIEEIDSNPGNNLSKITRVSLVKKIRPNIPTLDQIGLNKQRTNFIQFLPERIDVVAGWYGWIRKNEESRVIYYVGLPN